MKAYHLLIFILTANIAVGAEDPPHFFPQTLEEKVSLKGIDNTTRGGHTPLFIISMMGNSPETVQLLIDNGADINKQDDDGDTPLIAAVCFNKERSAGKIAEVLIQNDADLNIRDDEYGLTVGHCALGKENWDILLTLLSEESFDLFVKLDANTNSDKSLLDMLAVRFDIVGMIQDMRSNVAEEGISQNQANEMFKSALVQTIQNYIQEKRLSDLNQSAKNFKNQEERI